MPLPPDGDPEWDGVAERDRAFQRRHPDCDEWLFNETIAITELRERQERLRTRRDHGGSQRHRSTP